MKKFLFLVLITAIMGWGCSSLVYVSDVGQLMKARENAPLQPSNLFTTNNTGGMPDISNNNIWVAFSRSDHKIVLRKLDGSMERVLEQKGSWPRWSPMGDRIVFWDPDENKICILKVTDQTSTGYNLPDENGHDWWNNDTIVYSRRTGSTTSGEEFGLYFYEIPTNQDTGPIFPCSNPAVSRDGKLMACDQKVRYLARNFLKIYIFEVPSFRLKSTITFEGTSGTSIWNIEGYSFSGDNQRLLFSATPPNETQKEIYSVKVDGTGMKRLSTIPGNDTQPSGYIGYPW